MNDAGEVLLSIYERVMGVADPAGHAVNALFGLCVSEHVQCGACGKATHQNTYTQYFHNTQVGGTGWRKILSAACFQADGASTHHNAARPLARSKPA